MKKITEEITEGNIALEREFTTDRFFEIVRKDRPAVGRTTIYKALKQLCAAGRISRIGKGHFTSIVKGAYSFELSKKMLSIASLISNKYPLADYQVWELEQMNEFVNHQIVRNTLFIEVEAMLEESVFELLFPRYGQVLFNPSVTEYYKYMGDETVVVRRLLSEAPPAYGMNKQAALEKLLVDLFGRGLPGNLIERSEYPGIFTKAFEHYNINQARLFRYARRRNLEEKIMNFLLEETNISLGEGHDR